MPNGSSPEQHVAVFGESGSGKTVLVSSFFGSNLDAARSPDALVELIAENTAHSTSLRQNYLGMKNTGVAPMPTRYAATSYSFVVRLKSALRRKRRSDQVLRMVWHDYPGEWFEQDASGEEEARRRVDTFRKLLDSHVAVLLVDGQRLLDNAGEEERYLRSLLGNMRNVLMTLEENLLEGGRRLRQFPRIWIIGMSKADLLPELDVSAFQELVIEKAGHELTALRATIAGFVDNDGALSVGEDFLLLSSAKFDAGRIEVDRRIGVDLIMPIAAVLPFERFGRWAEARLLPGRLAQRLLSNAPLVAAAVSRMRPLLERLPGRAGAIAALIDPEQVALWANAGNERLIEMNREAAERRDGIKATLTRFLLDIRRGEAERVLARSPQ